MRRLTTALLAAGALILGAQAQATIITYNLQLTHSQETAQGPFLSCVTAPCPLNNIPGSTRPLSFGTATIIIDDALPLLSFTATIFNIDVNGTQTPTELNDNLTAAHIHVGAALGANAPVRWGFFGAPFNNNNPNEGTMTPFATGVGGTFTGTWNAPEGNSTTLAAQLPGLLAGLGYINFHTTQFGGGEIRGQIVPEPATLALLGLGLFGLAGLRRKSA